MRSSDWLLIVVGVRDSKCSTGNDAQRIEQHGSERMSERKGKRKRESEI